MKKTKHTKQQRQKVKQALEYLIAEGFVVKVGNKYRLKTEEEIAKEINA